MRLIGQSNGEDYAHIDVPYETSTIILREEYGFNNESKDTWSIYAITDGEYRQLAVYGSKDRSLDVLKDMNQTYIKFKETRETTNTSFTFPKE